MPGHVQLNDGDNTLVRPKVGKLINLLFCFSRFLESNS